MCQDIHALPSADLLNISGSMAVMSAISGSGSAGKNIR